MIPILPEKPLRKDMRMKKIGSSRASPRRADYFWLAAGPVIAAALAITVAIGMSVFSQSASAATGTVDLGTATPYAVLAGSTVTNTGPSVINGDLGVYPHTAVTGFGGAPNGTVINGTIHAADASAGSAQSALTTAYNDAAGRPKTSSVPGPSTAPVALGPGVYNATSALEVGGSLTLDGGTRARSSSSRPAPPSSPTPAPRSSSPAAPRPATSSGRWAAPRPSIQGPPSWAPSWPRP